MMSTPLLGVVEGGGPANAPSFHKNYGLTERNYLGLSDCSSVDSCSNVSSVSEVNKNTSLNLNLKATELRLGLPGSQSPDRDPECSSDKFDEKPLFPLVPTNNDGICLSSPKSVASGHKRVYIDAMDSGSEIKGVPVPEPNWMFGSSRVESDAPKSSALNTPNVSKINSSNPPAAKAQVVGWPPVRSFRKNMMATSSKNNEEVDGKRGPGALFVKVSMDGAPYLRKVDLRGFSTYQQLSSALEKMFSCFTIGRCGSQGGPGRENLSESKLRDLLDGSEYVLSYEDKDGDWMLVGDVPWDMFIGSCKRLKIMKGSDAIGLAPRAAETSKIKN
ncbi:auxin-responsive protein IAA8-like [Rutidosis leptorrhynchoides]|uniref:auxin-responsive protein IAA8-like n=1 Tax=Rutidosis leptorrhynchoides TaxID=125765 RepID=UPI003A99344F